MIENQRKDNNFIELKSLAESFKLKQINNHSLLVDSNSNSNNDKKRTSYDLSSLKVK